MRWTAEIVVVQDVDPRIVPELAPKLSVSLDCIVCKRHARTVVFHRDVPDGRCFPGSATRHLGPHPFPGTLLDTRVAQRADGFDAAYRIAYDTHPFVDAKHGDAAGYRGHPLWAAVMWEATCPDCGVRNKLGTQTNVVRPSERRCRCSLVMQREHRELPVMRYLDPDLGAWREVEARFSAP